MTGAVKKLFAEHFISAGPRGSIAQGRDEFARIASKAAEFYRSVGQTSAKILSMDVMKLRIIIITLGVGDGSFIT